MQTTNLEVWHLIAIVIGSLAAGNGMTSAMRTAFDYFKAKFFTPDPGPSPKELLAAVLSHLADVKQTLAASADTMPKSPQAASAATIREARPS